MYFIYMASETLFIIDFFYSFVNLIDVGSRRNFRRRHQFWLWL